MPAVLSLPLPPSVRCSILTSVLQRPAVLSLELPPSVRCSILTSPSLCPLFYPYHFLPLLAVQHLSLPPSGSILTTSPLLAEGPEAVLSLPIPPSVRCSILTSPSLCPMFYPCHFLPLLAIISLPASSLWKLFYPYPGPPLSAVLSLPLPPSARCSILTSSALCLLYYPYLFLILSAVLSLSLPPSARC